MISILKRNIKKDRMPAGGSHLKGERWRERKKLKI